MLSPSRRDIIAFTSLLGGTALLPASVRAQQTANLQVVATTGMIADAVREVGGSHVAVRALLGPGVDPHLYRQTGSDIAAAVRADAVFWHGLHLEAQMMDLFVALGRNKPVIALADRLAKADLLQKADVQDLPDPHVWMDPTLWKGVVTAARDALSAIRPDAAEDFARNAAAYAAAIDALVAYSRDVLGSVPAQSRVLVTAHDAFGYFGRAYGFDVLGVQGVSTESEAGLRQIETLIGTLVERRIGAIFVESSVSDRNVRALIEGAAARGHRVAIGGQLYSDAMGRAGTYEGTYLGMIDHNVTVIARALGGKAPPAGLNARLSES